jgi:peptidoglycan hydrolase-like protein with peptidoglycan-binding domain
MTRFTTAVCVFALALAWAVSPALAEDTKGTREPGKKEAAAVAATTNENDRDTITGRASEDVRQAQQALKDRGFDPGPIAGLMGPQTKAAIGEYQAKEHLKVTGRLDSQTKEQLMMPVPAASSEAERTGKQ